MDGSTELIRLREAATGWQTLHVKEGAGPLVAHLPEAGELYYRVFNGVSEIRPQWTLEDATGFLRDRAHETGVVSVLLFDGARLVGAFIGVLVAKADGFWIADIDVLLDPGYRRNGLGRTLYYSGHLSAARTALARFGERPSTIEFSTYSEPDYPKDWWLSLGHQPFPLFTADIGLPPQADSCKDITLQPATAGDIDAIAAFMAAGDTEDLNSSVWTRDRAGLFLNFALRNPSSLLRVAVAGNEIVGLIGADLLMRRSGPSLTHLTCIERGSQIICRQPALTGMLLAELAHAANRRSRATYAMRAAGLELTERQANRLRPVLPGIRMDAEFIGMSMPFDACMAVMKSRHGRYRMKQTRASLRQD